MDNINFTRDEIDVIIMALDSFCDERNCFYEELDTKLQDYRRYLIERKNKNGSTSLCE